MAITYKTAPNKLDIQVLLDGKIVGHIRRGHWGWAYQAKGTKYLGTSSFSLDVVKREIEEETA
jgi:hypothetical protein